MKKFLSSMLAHIAAPYVARARSTDPSHAVIPSYYMVHPLAGTLPIMWPAVPLHTSRTDPVTFVPSNPDAIATTLHEEA
jgi:hypothetical protein